MISDLAPRFFKVVVLIIAVTPVNRLSPKSILMRILLLRFRLSFSTKVAGANASINLAKHSTLARMSTLI